MSSIVSLRPPFSVPTSQSNEFFWMSMRFGTSSTFSRRAKLRRVRGASREAKTATPQVETCEDVGARLPPRHRELSLRGTQARPAKIAQGGAYPSEGHSALTDPARPGSRMWREGRCGRLRLSAECRHCSRGVNRRARLPHPGDGVRPHRSVRSALPEHTQPQRGGRPYAQPSPFCASRPVQDRYERQACGSVGGKAKRGGLQAAPLSLEPDVS